MQTNQKSEHTSFDPVFSATTLSSVSHPFTARLLESDVCRVGSTSLPPLLPLHHSNLEAFAFAALLKGSPSCKIHWPVSFLIWFFSTAFDIPSFLGCLFSWLLVPPTLLAVPSQSSLLASSTFIGALPAPYDPPSFFFIIYPFCLADLYWSHGYKYYLYAEDSQICLLVPISPFRSTLVHPPRS